MWTGNSRFCFLLFVLTYDKSNYFVIFEIIYPPPGFNIKSSQLRTLQNSIKGNPVFILLKIFFYVKRAFLFEVLKILFFFEFTEMSQTSYTMTVFFFCYHYLFTFLFICIFVVVVFVFQEFKHVLEK